jgi:hypothetical protein
MAGKFRTDYGGATGTEPILPGKTNRRIHTNIEKPAKVTD